MRYKIFKNVERCLALFAQTICKNVPLISSNLPHIDNKLVKMSLLQVMRHAVPFLTTGVYNAQRRLIYSDNGIISYLFPMFRKQSDISLKRKQQFMYLPFNIPRRMIYAVTGMKHVVVSQQSSSPAGRLSATFFLGSCLCKPLGQEHYESNRNCFN